MRSGQLSGWKPVPPTPSTQPPSPQLHPALVVGHHPIALHVFPLHCGLSPRNVHSTLQPGGFPASTQSAADEKTVSVYLSSGTKVIGIGGAAEGDGGEYISGGAPRQRHASAFEPSCPQFFGPGSQNP